MEDRNMSNLVHNEQTKMMANFFNSLGVVSFATGVIVPVVSVVLTHDTRPITSSILALLFGVVMGIGLFFAAQYTLEHLQEEK